MVASLSQILRDRQHKSHLHAGLRGHLKDFHNAEGITSSNYRQSIQLDSVLAIELKGWILTFFPQKAVANYRTSISVPVKQRKASSGVQTIGSPRTLKLVLTSTEQPVFASKAANSAEVQGLVSLCIVWKSAE